MQTTKDQTDDASGYKALPEYYDKKSPSIPCPLDTVLDGLSVEVELFFS